MVLVKVKGNEKRYIEKMVNAQNNMLMSTPDDQKIT